MAAHIALISPALEASNNGNWQTARRWRRMLARDYRVDIDRAWDGGPADLMIALHARRSAGSIARFSDTGKPIAVVLTGTDLYRDIDHDAEAQHSLALADRLVVLNPAGSRRLPAGVREKTVAIVQSAPRLDPLPPRVRSFDLLLIGHLRPEKDPMTAVRALSRLSDPALRLVHVGRIDDPQTGPPIRRAARRDPRIELLGPQPHARTRRRIRRGRVLLLTSLMEGGANVLIEAVQSGIPVLASDIESTVGLLGEDYPGLFPVGDDAALAALIARCRAEPGFIGELTACAAARAAPFDPAVETAAVRALVRDLLRGRVEDAACAGRSQAPRGAAAR